MHIVRLSDRYSLHRTHPYSNRHGARPHSDRHAAVLFHRPRLYRCLFASDAARTKNPPCFALDRKDLAVGERLRGDALPVLWPPPASLPETPSLIGESTGPQMRSVS